MEKKVCQDLQRKGLINQDFSRLGVVATINNKENWQND